MDDLQQMLAERQCEKLQSLMLTADRGDADGLRSVRRKTAPSSFGISALFAAARPSMHRCLVDGARRRHAPVHHHQYVTLTSTTRAGAVLFLFSTIPIRPMRPVLRPVRPPRRSVSMRSLHLTEQGWRSRKTGDPSLHFRAESTSCQISTLSGADHGIGNWSSVAGLDETYTSRA